MRTTDVLSRGNRDARRWDDPPSRARAVTHGTMIVAIVASLLATAFGLGWWLGRSDVEPSPPVAQVCPPTAECVCPECVAPSAPAERRAHASSGRTARRGTLPALEAAGEESPREPMLGWIRQRAPSLRRCLGPGSPRRSFRVRLEVAAGGQVEDADVAPIAGELTPDARQCIELAIERWVLPPELLADLGSVRPESLIFTLAL